MADPTWIRARRCSSSACVEVAATDEFIHLRASECPDLEILFTHDEWIAFIGGVRDGDFDELGET